MEENEFEPFYLDYQEIWKHEKGNPECKVGQCLYGGPAPCKCGGLVHTDFLDEDWDSVYYTHKCDECGQNNPADN